MTFKELTTKSEAEVKHLLVELREKAHDLSVKSRLRQLKNNQELKSVKKDIARVMTFLGSKK